MRERIRARLEELRRELEMGQAELEKVERQRTYLLETLLRIGGAVQVLEELLTEGRRTGRNGDGADEAQPVTTQADGADR